MTAIVLLFVTGALLLAAEVFLPGAVAGIIGAMALLFGSFLAFSNFGPAVGTAASAGALVLLAIMLYVELVWLPRSRFGRRLVVQATVDGQATVPATREVVGKTASALTTLAPSGYVSVDGKRYEAFSRSGHAVRGASLVVVDVDNFRLIVSQSSPQ
jgi:membrane-bound ClpP family serine protease